VRATALAVVVVVASVLGAAAALMLARVTGWGERERIERIVLPAAQDEAAALTPLRPGSLGQEHPAKAAFDPSAIYRARAAGVVTIYAAFSTASGGEPSSQGSGFVVSREGYLLTNAHVITTAPGTPVEPADRLYVEFEDGDRIEGEIVGYDLFNDVGLVKVDPSAHRLVPIPLGEAAGVVVGQPVAAIGSPFGNQTTLTVGVVSATERQIASLASGFSIIDAIQTDTPINHGNSGGPLLDADGRAVGINAQIRTTSGENQGVGFAVPIDSAKRSMRELIASGRVSYAYVGLTTEDLTPTVARHFRYRPSYGAVIECVQPGSPGERSGLRAGRRSAFNGRVFVEGGDVVVGINGKPVRRGEDLVRIIAQELRPGQVASFRIVRGSERRTVPVSLSERPRRPTVAC